jgi:hypothetical protein
MTYLSSRQVGSTITAFDTANPSTNYGTWTISAVQQISSDLIQITITYVSGAGISSLSSEWALTFTQ